MTWGVPQPPASYVHQHRELMEWLQAHSIQTDRQLTEVLSRIAEARAHVWHDFWRSGWNWFKLFMTRPLW